MTTAFRLSVLVDMRRLLPGGEDGHEKQPQDVDDGQENVLNLKWFLLDHLATVDVPLRVFRAAAHRTWGGPHTHCYGVVVRGEHNPSIEPARTMRREEARYGRNARKSAIVRH